MNVFGVTLTVLLAGSALISVSGLAAPLPVTRTGATVTVSSAVEATSIGAAGPEWPCIYSRSDGKQWDTCATLGTGDDCDILKKGYHYKAGRQCPAGHLYKCDSNGHATLTLCAKGCTQGPINTNDTCH